MGVEALPAVDLKFWLRAGGCPAKYCQVESNVVSELNVSYRIFRVSGSIPGLGKNFSTFVTSVARKSSGQLARKMIVVRPCINA